MKGFWSTGLASIETPKAATVFSKSDTSCLKLPCDISQSVLRDSSYTQSHMQERSISLNRVFQLLHSCHQQIKFKKIKTIKKHHQAPEIMFWSSKISDEIIFSINEKVCLSPSQGWPEGIREVQVEGEIGRSCCVQLNLNYEKFEKKKQIQNSRLKRLEMKKLTFAVLACCHLAAIALSVPKAVNSSASLLSSSSSLGSMSSSSGDSNKWVERLILAA